MKLTKTVYVFSFILFCLNSFCQKKLLLKFEYNTQTYVPNEKEPFRFYYIIDSAVSFKQGNITFYTLIISRDSTMQTGFIAYDAKSGDLVFLKDSSRRKKATKIFRLKTRGTTEIEDIPDLYRLLVKTVQKNSVVFTISRKNIIERKTGKISQTIGHDSHAIYLAKVVFEKGKLYPQTMTFFFPFEEGKGLIKLSPSSVSQL